jgi:hypothetical protein
MATYFAYCSCCIASALDGWHQCNGLSGKRDGCHELLRGISPIDVDRRAKEARVGCRSCVIRIPVWNLGVELEGCMPLISKTTWCWKSTVLVSLCDTFHTNTGRDLGAARCRRLNISHVLMLHVLLLFGDFISVYVIDGKAVQT